jgi:CBS domain containing-hemolysin-like protein
MLKNKLKESFSNPVSIAIMLTCLIISVYVAILIFEELKPKTYSEQYLHCLELGSNMRTRDCIDLLDNNK